MINNFTILFFTIITNMFAVLTNDVVLTDFNNKYEFNIEEIECVGRIRIDERFITYAVKECGGRIIPGKNLQSAIMSYIENICDLHHGDKKYNKAHQLVHDTTFNESEIIDIGDLGSYLYN